MITSLKDRSLRRVFCTFVFVSLWPATLLALPDYEPFNYSPSANLIGQTTPDGLTWVAAGAGATQITVASGNLSWFGLAPSAGNSIQVPSTSSLSARMPVGFTVTSGTLYYSFLMKVADLTGLSTTGSHLAGFNNSVGSQTQIPTAVGTRLLLRTTGTGGFNIGLSKASSTTTDWTWSSAEFQTNQTVFLVGSYTINSANTSDDLAKLWINPDPSDFGSTNPVSTPLMATSGSDIPANQIASFVFFQRTGGVQPALTIADELRIGRTFADVTPTNSANQTCEFPVCPGARGIVQCLEFTNKNYDVYLPPAYSPTGPPLPILYTFHPNGNGMVGNFGAVASDMQIIVVGIRESSNAVDWYDFIDAVYAIVRDIRKRVRFDPTAEFTTGWSGGGYEAYMHSQILRQEISGVYPMCSWMPHYDSTYRYSSNLLVTRANALADNTGLNSDWAPDGAFMDSLGIRHYDTWFPGPHAVAPDTNKLDCLGWLISHRAPPGTNDENLAATKAALWRAAITNGESQRVFAECFNSVMSKPRSFEQNQAQLILDTIQSSFETFRAFNVTNLWPGDFASDYLYFRAYGAAKIGDTNTYYSCLKTATWLQGTSGDRTNDFKALIDQYGFPRPRLAMRYTAAQLVITFIKEAPFLDYFIQQSTDLNNPSWTALPITPVDNNDGTCSFTIGADGSAAKFLRVQVHSQ